MSHDLIPFEFLAALQHWAAVTGILALVAMAIGVLISLLTPSAEPAPPGAPRGNFFARSVSLLGKHLVRSFRSFFRSLWTGLVELGTMSPRRLWALTLLVFKESMRRKILAVMVVFGVCFLFAGWFLSTPTENTQLRQQVYIAFVLNAVTWLSLPAVFLMACWGLPDDIKARSLHTVVTKPARRSEVLVGRILGFCLVGTLVIGLMSTVGYLWLIRALPESNSLVARVPIYGKFHFLDREGNVSDKGINVGDIWEFRGYIEGNTRARGIWDFEGVSDRLLTDDKKLRIELVLEAFRTHKGDIEQQVLCDVIFVNPTTKTRALYKTFPIIEFSDKNVLDVDRALVDAQNQPVDLFRDLVDQGKLQIELACRSPGQFLGMARPSLFIRDRDHSFASSYFKSMIGTWSMMVLIVVFAVTASTVLKGPVTFILSLVFLLLGVMARDLMNEITDPKKWQAGSVLEGFYRMVAHMNPQVEIKESGWVNVMKAIDNGPMAMLWAAKFVIPDFTQYHMSEYVIKQYDVPFREAVLPAIMNTVGYVIPCIIFGYFCLRARELESK